MFEKIPRQKKHDALMMMAQGVKLADIVTALSMSERTMPSQLCKIMETLKEDKKKRSKDSLHTSSLRRMFLIFF
jgi:hypothetical protein